MPTRLFKAVIYIIFAIFLFSCSSSPPLDNELRELGLRRTVSSTDLPIFRVINWQVLNDRNLVITTRPDNQYLIELVDPCPTLTGAFRIGFVTPADSRDRFESILIRSEGNPISRCDIRNITGLERI